MKVLFAAAMALAANVAAGQEFYVRAGLGFAIPQAGQTVYDTPIPYYEFASAYNGTRTYNSNGSQTYNIKPSSFSAGLQSAIGVGYMFTPNIGVQLDASIGLSNTKYTFTDENLPLVVATTGTTTVTVPYNISTVQQAKTPTFLMPSLVLQTSAEKLNGYARFGFALPLNTKVTQDQILTNAPGTGTQITDDLTWQVKNSFSLGFTAAAGVKYKISDKVSIWGELSLLSMSVYTREQNLTGWTESGQSVALSNYTGPQNIKFSKTATVDSTYSQFPTYAQSFSNVGLNVGIIITISKHERSSRSSDEYIDHTKPFRRKN